MCSPTQKSTRPSEVKSVHQKASPDLASPEEQKKFFKQLLSPGVKALPLSLFQYNDKGITFYASDSKDSLERTPHPWVENSLTQISDTLPNTKCLQFLSGLTKPGSYSIQCDGSDYEIWHTPWFDPSGHHIGGQGLIVNQSSNQDETAGVSQREMIEHLLSFHEQDRQLLAFDIHDGLVQEATAAHLQLEGLLHSGEIPPGATWEKVEQANHLIRKAVEEARRLIGGLRPAPLDRTTLKKALEQWVAKRPEELCQIELMTELTEDRFQPLLESCVYRLVQEGINNIDRHSKAKRAEIRLSLTGKWLHLEIQDWGIGFNPDIVREDRFGLQGIRERPRFLGGHTIIESAPGIGTLIVVDLPVVKP